MKELLENLAHAKARGAVGVMVPVADLDRLLSHADDMAGYLLQNSESIDPYKAEGYLKTRGMLP